MFFDILWISKEYYSILVLFNNNLKLQSNFDTQNYISNKNVI